MSLGELRDILVQLPALYKRERGGLKRQITPQVAEQVSGRASLESKFLHLLDLDAPKEEHFKRLSSDTFLVASYVRLGACLQGSRMSCVSDRNRRRAPLASTENSD